jgi:hypothetical protein
LLAFAENKHKQFDAEPLQSRMGVDEPFLVHSSEAHNILTMICDVHLRTSAASVSKGSVDALLALLRKTELYATSRTVFGFVPAREEDVHQRIQGLLECAYPDVDNRPPLSSKGIKSFIPDTGIKSLRTVIDYKFITDKAGGRKVLDEVYADISGYQSDEYDTFIFVIYETTRAFREEEWATAIARSKPGVRVEVVVLKGTPFTLADKKASNQLKKKRTAEVDDEAAPSPTDDSATGHTDT